MPVIAKKTGENGSLKISYTLDGFSSKKYEESPKQTEKNIRKQEMDKKADERVKKLRELSMKFGDEPKDLENLESVPAYVRKNVQLNPVVPASESVTARFTLSDEESDADPDSQGLKDGGVSPRENTFLHNKPDWT